jgi:uncharacterized SAM-binding protein YcdF (DUF218 family)
VAAALVERGYAQGAIVPQTASSPEMEDGLVPPTFEIIRRVLTKRGLTDSQIQRLDSASSSTWEDAEALARFLKSQPQARVLAVTHHYHTRRARWVFRQVLGSEAARLTFVSAPTDEFDATNWWRTKAGFQAIVTEYFKFAYYLLRYGDWRAWSVLLGAAALLAVRFFRGAHRGGRTRSTAPAAYHTTSTPAVGPWK